ncbi:MAG: hypothetical protein U0835_19075 [Isosphaeraceae bacterium]
MEELVPVVLAAWALGVVALFATRPGRTAAVVALVSGWALLPVATYPAWAFIPPAGSGGTIHALAVPTSLAVNKATVIGLACLAGVVLFGWPELRRVRPAWCDLPIAVWCLAPAASALVNGLGPAEALALTRYQVLAWGVPYLLGRVYLGDNESLRGFGVAMAVGGAAYAALALAEVALGPFLYEVVYGPHPYIREGAARGVGYRPLGFQEHGNQLGLWMALTAVAGGWLWWSGRLRTLGGVPGAAVAAAPVAGCVAAQSHGAIALMAAALAAPPLLGLGRGEGGKAVRGVVVVALVLAAAGGVAAAVASGGSLRQKVQGAFVDAGKRSFTWRVARYQEFLGRAAQRPVLGRAGRLAGEGRPRVREPGEPGALVHAFGMLGAVGLIASTAVFLGPLVSAGGCRRAWLNPVVRPSRWPRRLVEPGRLAGEQHGGPPRAGRARGPEHLERARRWEVGS